MTAQELITWISYTAHVTDHALITWLIMHWSGGYHALIILIAFISVGVISASEVSVNDTYAAQDSSANLLATDEVAIMQCWCFWSCNEHVTEYGLIAKLSCTDHMAAHAMITWLIMHWSCTDLVAIMHWSLDSACNNHMDDHAFIMRLIMH